MAAMTVAIALVLPAARADVRPTARAVGFGSCHAATDEVALLQVTHSEVAPVPQASQPPGAAGWYLANRANCDDTCAADGLGLVCTTKQLMAHNGDVDTETEVNKLIEGIAGLTCESYSTSYGANPDVPTYNNKLCYVSSSDRPESSYSCTSKGGGNRLCYCHEKEEGWCAKPWDSTDFSVCDYFGDPHFKKNYKQDSNFDLMGQGPYVSAGSKSDFFEVQNFQCPYGPYATLKATMTHGLAVRFDTNVVVLTVDGPSKKPMMWLNGKKATEKEINAAGIKTTGKFLTQVPGFQLMTEDCKYRIDNQYRGPSKIYGVPGFVFDNLIRVPQDDSDFQKGMCSGCEYQKELSADDLLFSDEQIQVICQHCQVGTPPRICTENFKPATPVPAPTSCAEIPHPCELPEAVAAGCDFDAAMEFCSQLKGTECFAGCQFDYCAMGCTVKGPVEDKCMPEPPPPDQVKVTGDPHVTNVRGERFDVRRLGFSELLRLPRQVAEGAQPLLSVLGKVEADSTCADTFIKEFDFLGGWLSRSGKLTLGTSGAGRGADEAISLAVNGTALDVAGLRAVEGLKDVLEVVTPETRHAKESTIRAQKILRQTFLTVNMRFPLAKLSVEWVHRRTPFSNVNHLNLKVASLPKPMQGMEVGGILGLDDHAAATVPPDHCKRVLLDAHTALLKPPSSTEQRTARLEAEGLEPAKVEASATYEDEYA